MRFAFTDPIWLWLLPLAWAWVIWFALRSDVSISRWRLWTSLGLRLVVVGAAVLALAGLRWMMPREGMNVYYLLDRSDSVPTGQQEEALRYVNESARGRKEGDQAGVLVFGTGASLESTVQTIVDLQKVQAVVDTERTDIAGAIRLGTAALPEVGQKRLVLLSDGNQNIGDAVAAVLAARPLGVTVDVVPLDVARRSDVSVQKLGLPARVKLGQTFEAKIFVESDRTQPGTIRLYRNDQPLGEQRVELAEGKNLFTFPQTLNDAGFFDYTVQVETAGDDVPQNNEATAFINVRGQPRGLVISSDPAADTFLVQALRATGLEADAAGLEGLPSGLAEMQSYDVIFLSNLSAGDLGRETMSLLSSAVKDFGVGLVCVGGDQAYAAGGYRRTPLEEALPLNMELDSKKVLPKGAVVLVMHGMEFMNGNQVARDCALGVLDALGPKDELGVLLWDGFVRWLFPLSEVGDKKDMGRQIQRMNQGDLPGFQDIMEAGYKQLKESNANMKHMIIFSDGDPGPPSQQLMDDMVRDRITVSTVLIAGHFPPTTMIYIADTGNGRFYDVKNPSQLPQIFVKEAAVILKSAIFEEPFTPNLVLNSALVEGIGADEYPVLEGYVATTPKGRAEVPLLSDKGDPVLAHWQYGLGRAVAFTSDAKAKWAKRWLNWDKFRQFWGQVGQWSLRRLDSAELSAEISVENGEGWLSVEAVDERGDYRNFLNLKAVVVSPSGEQETVYLEQTGPGHYETRFTTKEVGGYMVNLMEIRDGRLVGSLALGASVNYSPEFDAAAPNLHLLRRLAEAGGGRVLDPGKPVADNTFHHDRQRTHQPQDLWEWLLKFAILLFPLDVAVRRIQLDREEWLKATENLRRWIFFWRGKPRVVESDESLGVLLSRRSRVRAERTGPRPELFEPAQPAESLVRPEGKPVSAPPPSSEPARSEEPKRESEAEPGGGQSTASRLLDAKRRAQQRRKS